MTSAILSLRKGILERLAGDPTLAGLIGGPRIYDEPPRAVDGVYITFGEANARDASTSSDQGHEHNLALVVWSKPGGARPALIAAARVAQLLDDADLALEGQRLVRLAVMAEELRRDDRAHLARVTLRLRAVTETLD